MERPTGSRRPKWLRGRATSGTCSPIPGPAPRGDTVIEVAAAGERCPVCVREIGGCAG
jgi:hypothetical protein